MSRQKFINVASIAFYFFAVVQHFIGFKD